MIEKAKLLTMYKEVNNEGRDLRISYVQHKKLSREESINKAKKELREISIFYINDECCEEAYKAKKREVDMLYTDTRFWTETSYFETIEKVIRPNRIINDLVTYEDIVSTIDNKTKYKKTIGKTQLNDISLKNDIRNTNYDNMIDNANKIYFSIQNYDMQMSYDIDWSSIGDNEHFTGKKTLLVGTRVMDILSLLNLEYPIDKNYNSICDQRINPNKIIIVNNSNNGLKLMIDKTNNCYYLDEGLSLENNLCWFNII